MGMKGAGHSDKPPVLPLDIGWRRRPKGNGRLWIEVTYWDGHRLDAVIDNDPLKWDFQRGYVVKVAEVTGRAGYHRILEIGIPRAWVKEVVVLGVLGRNGVV